MDKNIQMTFMIYSKYEITQMSTDNKMDEYSELCLNSPIFQIKMNPTQLHAKWMNFTSIMLGAKSHDRKFHTV